MTNLEIAFDDTTVSDDQIETSVTLVGDAIRKATRAALRDLAKRGVLTAESIGRERLRHKRVVAAVTTVVKQQYAELAEDMSGYVKLISGAEVLTLDPTDGTEMIAKANNIFTGFLGNDFVKYGINVPSLATGKTNVTVHEMIKDGKLAQIFGSMSDDLNQLCLTQPQIIQFVQKYNKWLCGNGCGTFFLLKVGDVFLVVRMFVRAGGPLRVRFRRLSDCRVLDAQSRRRIVIPQQPKFAS